MIVIPKIFYVFLFLGLAFAYPLEAFFIMRKRKKEEQKKNSFREKRGKHNAKVK